MGKLNGQITEAQMQEIGLNLYVWSTSFDDRVRDSHALMEGLLCRYDDANLCSYDNGKTWVERPAGAVRLHPGQDIQCRCIALAFYPELEAEMENVSLSETTEGLEPVQDVVSIGDEAKEKYLEHFEKDVIDNLTNSEKSVIKHYTEAYYNTINNYLRNIKINFGSRFEAKRMLKKLDSSFTKIKPIDIDLVVYRREWTTESYFPNYKEGENIILNSFISTSLSKNNAKDGNIFYEIRIPKNKKSGLYISSLSEHNEKEFLLNRGMKYKVLKVEEIDELRRNYVLEFLGE